MKEITSKFNTNELLEVFSNREVFGLEDLYEFFTKDNKSASLNAVRIRVSRLVNAGILNKQGHGLYSFNKKREYIPEVSGNLVSIHKKLAERFPLLKFCIWHTSVINEFMLHQPFHFYSIIETEREAVESVFNFLKEGFDNIYVRPDQNKYYQYASIKGDNYVFRNLVTEAPIQLVKDVPTITLEKMLVDIFTDQELFVAQQGSELEHIYRDAFEKYSINQTRMLRYAYRRGKKDEIAALTKKIRNIRQ